MFNVWKVQLLTLPLDSAAHLLCLLTPWRWQLPKCQAVCWHAPGVAHIALGHKVPCSIAVLAGIAVGELAGAYGLGSEPASHKAYCQQQKADAYGDSRVKDTNSSSA
jgi:hypothetical protein